MAKKKKGLVPPKGEPSVCEIVNLKPNDLGGMNVDLRIDGKEFYIRGSDPYEYTPLIAALARAIERDSKIAEGSGKEPEGFGLLDGDKTIVGNLIREAFKSDNPDRKDVPVEKLIEGIYAFLSIGKVCSDLAVVLHAYAERAGYAVRPAEELLKQSEEEFAKAKAAWEAQQAEAGVSGIELVP